jgi:hypothetical protein
MTSLEKSRTLLVFGSTGVVVVVGADVVVVVVVVVVDIRRITGVIVEEAAGRAARAELRSVVVGVVMDDPWVDPTDALAAA